MEDEERLQVFFHDGTEAWMTRDQIEYYNSSKITIFS